MFVRVRRGAPAWGSPPDALLTRMLIRGSLKVRRGFVVST
jgi:hypothetical protein